MYHVKISGEKINKYFILMCEWAGLILALCSIVMHALVSEPLLKTNLAIGVIGGFTIFIYFRVKQIESKINFD